jgi:hypothetical protein
VRDQPSHTGARVFFLFIAVTLGPIQYWQRAPHIVSARIPSRPSPVRLPKFLKVERPLLVILNRFQIHPFAASLFPIYPVVLKFLPRCVTAMILETAVLARNRPSNICRRRNGRVALQRSDTIRSETYIFRLLLPIYSPAWCHNSCCCVCDARQYWNSCSRVDVPPFIAANNHHPPSSCISVRIQGKASD